MSKIEWTDRTWNPVVGCARVSEGCRHCYAETMASRVANAAQAKLRRGGALTATEAAYREVVRWECGGATAENEHDKALPRWNGQVRLIRERLADPLRWTKPARIFVNSMSDLFHAGLSHQDIAAVFGVMAAARWHTFQVLTKRPERAVEWFRWVEAGAPAAVARWEAGMRDIESVCISAGRPHLGRPEPPTPQLRAVYDTAPLDSGEYHWRPWPLQNVWLGVSVEDQRSADERIPLLLQCPAAVRWISAEPLLGPIDMTQAMYGEDPPGMNAFGFTDGFGYEATLHWVVAGGESGPGARPMHPNWPRSLRDQCKAAKVPFVFKQWGRFGQYLNESHYTYSGNERRPAHAWVDAETADHGECWVSDGDGEWSDWTGEPRMLGDGGHPAVAVMGDFGKKEAGRLLDGVLHDEYPEAP